MASSNNNYQKDPSGGSSPLHTLLTVWREEASVLERTGHEGHAQDVRRRIEELEDATRRSRDLWLPTEVAAGWSGYSEDHLRTLAQSGEVVAEKRAGTWHFLRSALPKKPTPREIHPDPDDLRPAERAARRALGARP